MLAQDTIVEDPLEPTRPIIDPHHHCWGDTPPVPEFPVYGLDDLMQDVVGAGHNVVATVYVEANSYYRSHGPASMRPVGETEYINKLGDDCMRRGGKYAGICAGIIAHADLLLGDGVVEVLQAHIAAAPKGLKGIRHRTSYDPDNFLYSIPKQILHGDRQFRAGFRHLAPLGLSFDACVFHPQLPAIVSLARSFPETSIILNHIGQPMMSGRFQAQGEAAFDGWSTSMAQLASCPNVTVKIGGMNMDFTGLSSVGEGYPTSVQIAHRQRGYVSRVIDLFGPNRCMFESNFPVDKVGISYDVVWNAFKLMAAGFSEDEKHSLFYGTANRVYRLGL